MATEKRIKQEEEEERKQFWAALLILALALLIAWGIARYQAMRNKLSLTLQHSQATGSLDTSGTLEPY